MPSKGMMQLFENGNLLDFYRCCHSYPVTQTDDSHRFSRNIWVHFSVPKQLDAYFFFKIINLSGK